MTTESLPQLQVNYAAGGNIGQNPMTVEASVYENNYTENEIEVYYIYDPEYKSINRNTVPRNMQVPLFIETNFFWQNNDKEMFSKFANFTCKFVLNGHETVTQGRMEKFPMGSSYALNGQDSPLPDHVVCPSPKMATSGKGQLYVSANGVAYDGTGFPL